MRSWMHDVVAVDRERVDLRAGLVGLAVVSSLASVMVIVGPVALAAVVGALVMLVAGPPPSGRRASTLVPLVVGGALVSSLAVGIGDRALLAAMLVGVVVVAASLQAGRSRRGGVRGLLMTTWVLTALTFHDVGPSPVAYALAFASGGVVGAVVLLVRSRGEPPSADDEVHDDGAQDATSLAVLRGLGLAIAVLVGFALFPDHPAWVAITTLLVLRPPRQQALVVGLQRSIGTGVGVIVAVTLAEAIGSNRPGLVILFLFSAFLMMAVREVNYALFAALLTTLVVYSQRILGADAAQSARDRLAETVLGVLIAFTLVGVVEVRSRLRRPTPAAQV